MKLRAAVFGVCLFGIPILGACQVVIKDAEYAAPSTPAPVKGILAARRFTLGAPYQYTWTKEPRMVSTGVLVVLEVDPAYVVPRDSLEPVSGGPPSPDPVPSENPIPIS
jgi:hypothetical protein